MPEGHIIAMPGVYLQCGQALVFQNTELIIACFVSYLVTFPHLGQVNSFKAVNIPCLVVFFSTFDHLTH